MKIVTDFKPSSHEIYCTLWSSDPLWHPCRNVLSVIAARSGEETYIIPIFHNDAGNNTMSLDRFREIVTDHTIFTNDLKGYIQYIGQHPRLHQVNKYNLSDKDRRPGPYLYPIGGNIRNAYQTLPLTIIAGWMAQDVAELVNGEVCGSYFNGQYLPVLARMEAAGIRVDRDIMSTLYPDVVKRHLGEDNLVYSWYNPFTSATRASNAWAGINFSALGKNSDARRMIVSRFDGGKLVSMDFDAYHLRLIANLMDLKVPTTSLHTELAGLYFKTDTVTTEQYEAGKLRTFEIIYGKTDETYGIELLDAIKTVRMSVWNKYLESGTLELATGVNVEVPDAYPSKVFNYFIQSLEVYNTIHKLEQILDYLETKQSKLILYTYDSILLDVHPDDDISEIIPMLEQNAEHERLFPVRVYSGTNYDNLKEVAHGIN